MSTAGSVHQPKLTQRRTIDRSDGASFVLYPQQRLVLVTMGSRITLKDLAEYARLLQREPSFEPTFSEIADIRAAEEVALDADDLMKIADDIDPFSPEAKRAFVVRTASQAHAARMHKILRTERNFQIFRSLDAAQRWIEA
ncbi:MAG TPA: hypothetical protein VGS05_10895 [Candidatus Sulfotelmatobacter sp.]|nr:hypothetical protein [Candidatus Sulfotelmatobacter sp.]